MNEVPGGEAKRGYGYKKSLRQLQIELVKWQRHLISHGHRVLVVFEGRDASGKDGTIKRIVEHLSPRETRVVALGVPSARDQSGWYFERFVGQLPHAGEMVLFNRSWYNRAGVERVMGFCTDAEYQLFMETVGDFESLLTRSGMVILKYYLDVSRAEQTKRLVARRVDPLKQWKTSPVDEVALERWDDYTRARDEMLARTDVPNGRWIVVRADNKKATRLNVIRDILRRVECPGKLDHLATPDPEIVFPFAERPRGALAK